MRSDELCSPALLYLVLSILGYLGLIYQNLTTKSYCVGDYECNSVDKPLAFIIKFVYIIVWTWILNILCNNGLGIISWTIVFLPFILTALLTTILLIEFGLDPSSGKLYRKEDTNETDKDEDLNIDLPKIEDPTTNVS